MYASVDSHDVSSSDVDSVCVYVGVAVVIRVVS